MTANLQERVEVAGGEVATLARTGDEVVIRQLDEDDIERVARELNPDRNAQTHRTRMRLQDTDTAAYLIAWHFDMPVAHGLLLWNGPLGNPKQHLPTQCPYIEDLWVKDDFRSQGVGSAMVETMETLVGERGHEHVGLSVGIDNLRGMSFYRRLGYAPLPVPIYTLSGVLQNAAGDLTFWSEECQYMRKSITATSGTRRRV